MRRLRALRRLLVIAGVPAVIAIAPVEARGAAVLFGATAAGLPGELYILSSATGAMLQDVGPLNDASGLNFGITGLAYNPITGLLYGSTHNLDTADPATQARLVTINPLTARVTVIGPFNAGNTGSRPATMADIAFDVLGNLYGVGTIGGPQLYSINQATGKATAIGSSGLTNTTGGGVDISASGVVYGTPTDTRFGTYNPTTGAYTDIVDPPKPVGGAYAALDFERSTDTLYGLDLGPAPALESFLVIFNQTGAVTNVGASVTGLDAIAFVPIPEPSAVALIACGTVAFIRQRRRSE